MDYQPPTADANWSWPPLIFRLTTSDADIAAQAVEIMSRWSGPPVESSLLYPKEAQSVLVQHVEKITVGQWRFIGSQPEAQGLCRSRADVFRAIEADAVLAILNRPDLFLTIHGALVTRESKTVLIIGSPMSGKSSLASVLGLSGWQLLCDDVTLLSQADKSPQATPVPRRINLRASSQSLFSAEQWGQFANFPNFNLTPEGIAFHPPHHHPASQSVPLSAIVFVRPTPANSGQSLITPLHPAEALIAATAYTNVIKTEGMGDSLKRLSPILNAVPAFNLYRAEMPRLIAAMDHLHHHMKAALP